MLASQCHHRASLGPGRSTNRRLTMNTVCSSAAAQQPYIRPPSSAYELVGMLAQPQSLQSSIGRPLTAEEGASLRKVIQLRSPELDVLGSLASGIDGMRSHIMQFLDAASHKQTTGGLEQIEGAMLLIEQARVLSGGQAPAQPTLTNRWQMLFTTAGAWPSRLQYIPVPEYFEVCPDSKHFRLESQMGPLFTSFYGDLEWLDTDYLHYHVTDIKVEVFGATMHTPTPIPDNDLKVFAMTGASNGSGGLACVRSSRGGLILMAQAF